MKRLIPAFCLLSLTAQAAWDLEDIPTAIQYTGGRPHLIDKEMASAYHPVYDRTGLKTGEHIAIAYRSKYLFLTQRQGTGWSSFRFDDYGRYPSVALDNSGQPHMSYFRTSNQKLYYAYPVAAGTGTCGPSLTWACDEIPTTIYGAPVGRSAITVHNTKLHLLVETASGNPSYPSYFVYLTKTIGAPNWTGLELVSGTNNLSELTIRTDNSGQPQVLIEGEFMDWFKRTTTNWVAIGPLVGTGSFDSNGSGAPRVCYHDATNRLIYAASDGTNSWTELVADYDIGAQGDCSIAMLKFSGIAPNPSDHSPRIAYYDDADDSIKYTMPPLLSLQPWTVQTVTSAPGIRSIHLHLDREARPTIIYFDPSALKLRLAK